MKSILYIPLILTISSISALTSSLADCNTVASNFSNTCSNASTDPGASVSFTNLQSCPGTTSGSTCTWTRKLCVTCRDDGGTTKIRVQTNALPNHSYFSPTAARQLNVDFQVTFSPSSSSTTATKQNPSTQTQVTNLLCDIQAHNSVPASSGYSSTGTSSVNTAVGVATTGVLIFNALSAQNTDPFYPRAYGSVTSVVAEQVDTCLAHPTPQGDFHYHIYSPCINNQNLSNIGPCRDTCEVKTQAKDGATLQNKQIIGIARDGHVIYGILDQNGAEWSQYDVCNGMYTDTGEYAYVSTLTFPYFSGCWGPASRPSFGPQCTTNGPNFFDPSRHIP